MKVHELKTMNPYFSDVYWGFKNFEVRYNDRDFQDGDFLLLREYANEVYLKREILCEITYIYDAQKYLKEGYVVLGIEVIKKMVI